MRNVRGAARVVELVQSYGRHTVLEGLNLTVRPGVLGVLGPGAAGKTTLLRTLATVLPPTSGRVELFGRAVESERAARRVRREVGYLPQDFGFHPSFTVREYVRYRAWLRECPRRRIDTCVERALDAVELTTLAGTRMRRLSGGTLRRAGIAGAVVGEPGLVLLDEPTRGLDATERAELHVLIRELATSRGTPVVLGTHLVQDVAAVCDEVAVLHEGRLLFADTPAALVRHAATPEAAAPPAASAAYPVRREVLGGAALERGYLAVLNGSRRGRVWA